MHAWVCTQIWKGSTKFFFIICLKLLSSRGMFPLVVGRLYHTFTPSCQIAPKSSAPYYTSGPWNEMAGKSLCFFFLDLTCYLPGYFTRIKNLRVLFKPNAFTNIRSIKIFVLMYYLPIIPILIKNMNFSCIDL